MYNRGATKKLFFFTEMTIVMFILFTQGEKPLKLYLKTYTINLNCSRRLIAVNFLQIWRTLGSLYLW